MYIVKIAWKNQRRFGEKEIVAFEVIPELEEDFKKAIELYESFESLFTKLIGIVKSSNVETLEYEKLGEEELRKTIEEFQAKCTNFESVNKDLEQRVISLSETNLYKEKDSLRGKINALNEQLRQSQEEIEKKKRECDKLIGELNTYSSSNQRLNNDKFSLEQNLESSRQEYRILLNNYGNLDRQYKNLQGQAANLPSLYQEIDKLRKSKKPLEDQISLIQKEFEETRQKLDLATARLHQQTVKPGISGGGSRSDQLKHDFVNLKMGLFRDASSEVLKCWQKQEPALTFRSEEFAKIRSILSQHVFADGMSYFVRDKSEINTYTELVTDALSSVEGLNLTPPILQTIQQKIETNLLRLKEVDTSDEALIKWVEATIQVILEDLQKIKDFSPCENVLQEIKNFVETGLRLVREVVNDPFSGEFYIPESEAEFDESLHDTRDEPEGKVKLTICAGYRIPGTVLVKADVVTYISNTQTTSAPESLLKDEDVANGAKQCESPVNQDQQYKPISNLEKYDKHRNIHAASFTGKVIPKAGVRLYSKPQYSEEYYSGFDARHNINHTFDAWTYSNKMKFGHLTDSRWYKIAGQDFWVPGSHIDGEPLNTSKIPPNKEEHLCEGK